MGILHGNFGWEFWRVILEGDFGMDVTNNRDMDDMDGKKYEKSFWQFYRLLLNMAI